MKKYKECIMYLLFLILLITFTIQQLKPRIESAITTHKNLTTQTATLEKMQRELKQNKTARLERLKKEKQEVELKSMYVPLKNYEASELAFDVLFEDFMEMVRKNNIKTHSFKCDYNLPDDPFIKGNASKYKACKVSLKLVTNYSEFEEFLKDLYKYNYLIDISNIEMYPYPKDKSILLVTFDAILYVSDGREEVPESESVTP